MNRKPCLLCACALIDWERSQAGGEVRTLDLSIYIGRGSVAALPDRSDVTLAGTAHVNVLIVGAGLSGIGAAVHLQKRCPSLSWNILEGRGATGGTWDLFRIPDIRSDSDMFTPGYGFRPWKGAKSIADGPSILEYICETAREFGVEQKVHLHHQVKRAVWSSADAR